MIVNKLALVFVKVSRFVLESLVYCTRYPDGYNRTPVCHSLPLISWTSCPRAVATILPQRLRIETGGSASHTSLFIYRMPTRSIHRSFQGLMIGLDCSANIGEPRITSPLFLTPFNVVYDFVRWFYSTYHLGSKEGFILQTVNIDPMMIPSLVNSVIMDIAVKRHQTRILSCL